MNCWVQLGISPTDDLVLIKKAFADRSKLHHPEEDPEGFQRLRAAYQQALGYAKMRRHLATIQPQADSDEPTEKQDTPPLTFRPLVCSGDLFDEPLQSEAAPADNEDNDTYSFTTVEGYENFADRYYQNTPDFQQKGLPKHEIRRRKLKSAKRTLKTLLYRNRVMLAVVFVFAVMLSGQYLTDHFDSSDLNPVKNTTSILAAGYMTTDKMVSLKEQALNILNDQAEARSETLNQIKGNVPFSECPSAVLLHITEAEYRKLLDDYKYLGEEAVESSLIGCRQAEEDFVRNKILPIIKEDITQMSTFLTALEAGAMIGMTYESCLTIYIQYVDDADITVLDQSLVEYNRLVPPDQWDDYLEASNEE